MTASQESSFGQTSGSGLERTYVTKQGDTLEDIAAYFSGDPVQRQRLIDDNPAFASLPPGETVPAGTMLAVSEGPNRRDSVPGDTAASSE